jgi:hypothetical protein
MTAITSGLAHAARRVAALERDLGRVAMLDRAIPSDDRAFKLAAAFTVALGSVRESPSRISQAARAETSLCP